MKLAVTERFSASNVDTSKKLLWDHCMDTFQAKNFVFHVRRDSDKRSQLAANLEDLIQMFNILDSVGKIPPIFCEASDLVRLPSLSLDPLAEELRGNSLILKHLSALTERLENKLSSIIPIHPTQVSPGMHHSYATAVTSAPGPFITDHESTLAPPISSSKQNQSYSYSDQRDLNLVLFGIPDNGSIVEAKKAVDEVFEFLPGKQIQIKDIFRLGRYTKSLSTSSRPRLLLIKLCTAWDRKLLLLRRFGLKDFHVKRLFLREDVAPDHQLRKRQSSPHLVTHGAQSNHQVLMRIRRHQ